MTFGREIKVLAPARKLFERDKLLFEQRIEVRSIQIDLIRRFLNEH